MSVMGKKYRDIWEDEPEMPSVVCWLCARDIGELTEWHHPIPKSRGGRERQPVHPICHEAIHANLSNSELAKQFSTAAALRSHDDIAKFLRWIADKPADFYAPTKSRR